MPGPEPSDKDLELLRYVKLQRGGFATAREVNDHTSVGYRQTLNRLDALADAGLLNVRTVGRTNVYWLTDEGDVALSTNDVTQE